MSLPVGAAMLAFHHGGALASHWVSHLVVRSVVNALVFGLVFRLIRHLSTPELLAIVAVVVGGIWFAARGRERARW